MIRNIMLLVACILVSPLANADDQVERLIDQLVKVSEPGFGYSGYFSGSEFLPYDNTGEIGAAVLGATRRARSEAMRKIVEKGADAVPMLLKHISDDRKIAMKPMSGMMWMDFSDEYDFNGRIQKKAPTGVNRDTFGKEQHPDRHALTVGDLCFVALGQIVNRRFSATRYQPTGGLVVNSPSYSKRLREVIARDWKSLTREKHKQLLIDDFKRPDYEDRRTGAYLRLAFYYSQAVEPLVLAELAKPTFDVFKIEALCRDRLYKTADKTKRRQIYTEFLRKHGDVCSVGIMDQLYDDLDYLEATEQGRVTPPLTEFSTQPRELLIELFDKPLDVKSSNRPFVAQASASERARFIGTLTHDKSKKIGEAVKRLFLENADDGYFANACLSCLASRGYGEFLVKQLENVDLKVRKANPLSLNCIEAISMSREKVVQDKLHEIVRTTNNAAYFMAALPEGKQSKDPVILASAEKILDGLPDNTDQGEELLQMIRQRYPSQAKTIYKKFLASGCPLRASTMCNVLWYGDPLSKELLAPLLNDRRGLEGFSDSMRVCDRAAQAISHTTDLIEFDSDWPVPRKDKTIVNLKRYCMQVPQP